MQKVVLLCLLLMTKYITAQPFKVEGTVIDADTKAPLANAYVFIDQSLNFTTTDSAGRYLLENIQTKNFELVVVDKSYQTLAYRANVVNERNSVKFELLKNPYVDSGFNQEHLNRFGQRFLINLIGTAKNADECELVNPEALRFLYSDTTDELFITAVEPLQIINEGLGYLVTVQLDSFIINGSDKKNANTYYSFFKPLSSKQTSIINKWNQRSGRSFQWFLQSLHKIALF